jgi:hypothetical protein
MYVRVVSKQAIEEVLFCCMPSAVSLVPWEIPRRAQRGSSWCSTTAAEATAAFTLARFLPVSDTRIWLVCPVTRTLLGRLGIERVLRFAKKCAHALPADTLKPIEEFTSAHPLFWFGASTKKSTHIPTTLRLTAERLIAASHCKHKTYTRET